MEFSYNYTGTMQRFSLPDHQIANFSNISMANSAKCPIEMHFKLTNKGGEVPVMAFNESLAICERNHHMLDSSYITVVVPLIESDFGPKTCSGADTILKSFTNRYGRLDKTVTPKGETYYGSRGIVLDKEYRPLLYVTRVIELQETPPGFQYFGHKTRVHVSPLVFTDDVGIVNKSILKKGIAYYLTHKVGDWGVEDYAEVVIDDGSWLFKKPNKPSPSDNIKETTDLVLKESISDILEQIRDDVSPLY